MPPTSSCTYDQIFAGPAVNSLQQESAISTNKRYAAHYDRLSDQRSAILEGIMLDGGTPDSLTEMELELEQQEIVRPAVAVKVQAWVRYGNVR